MWDDHRTPVKTALAQPRVGILYPIQRELLDMRPDSALAGEIDHLQQPPLVEWRTGHPGSAVERSS